MLVYAAKLIGLRKKAIFLHETWETKVIPTIRDIEVRATKASSWHFYGYNSSKLMSRVKTEAMKKIRYVCMYVFTDREGTKCPKKTVLGRR